MAQAKLSSPAAEFPSAMPTSSVAEGLRRGNLPLLALRRLPCGGDGPPRPSSATCAVVADVVAADGAVGEANGTGTKATEADGRREATVAAVRKADEDFNIDAIFLEPVSARRC